MSDPRESNAPADPYRAPRAELRPGPRGASIRLFGLSSIALASAVGTALTGGLLIALNYVSERRYAAALTAGLLVGPVLFAVAAMVAGDAAPADFPLWLRVAMAIAFQSVAAVAAADMLQRKMLRARRREGQQPAPRGLALIIAIVLLPPTVVIAVPAAALLTR